MLVVRELCKSFGRTQALRGVSLTVPAEKLTALVGPNASGKSTFMKAVLGLVRPDRGSILWQGKPLHALDKYQRLFGYMPQSPHYPDNLSPREILRIVRDMRGVDWKAFEAFIDSFRFGPFLDRPIGTLSLGTRQKLSAILALGVKAPILILDEPTVGFDPVAAGLFRRLFLERKTQGTTILFVSHLLQEVEAVADYIAFLDEGKILFSGSLAELQTRTKTASLEEAVLSLFDC
ncbi:MAG: ABC transporter ATP-binding protein [Candidatus Binatia bacterium]|nr:ABC transporter ATP-binding protein [Candidatus Binatia bacterium]